MASVASLVVSLGLDSAPYEKGLDKAQQSARTFANQIKASFIGNLGAGLAEGFLKQLESIPEAFKSMIEGAIEAGAHLQDLSKKTGIAVETLGGFGISAKQAGLDLDTVANASGKLNRQLAEAAAGNLKAGEAFKALGISVKDASGNTKTADTIIGEVADKFATFADGPEKAALAIRLFGKAGADMIPLLDQGGAKLRDNVEYFKRYSGITEETTARAKEFEDTLVKLKLLNGAFGNALISELLPTFQNLADAFVDLKEKSTVFQTAAAGIGTVFKLIVELGANVVFVFGGIGREIAAVAAQATFLGDKAADALSKNRSALEILKDPFGLKAAVTAAKAPGSGYSAISDQVKADGAQALKELNRFVAILNNPAQAFNDYSHEGAHAGPKPPAPHIGDEGADARATAELKKQLDGQIKLIDLWAQQRKDALDFSNRVVAGEYQDGLLTLQQAQDREHSIRQVALESELKQQDDRIAAERAFIAKLSNSPASGAARVDAANKIKESEERKNSAILKNAQAEYLATAENARAVEHLNDAYNDLTATVLRQGGNEAGAAAIRIARQFRDAGKLIEQAGGDPAIADSYKAQLEGIEKLKEAQTDYSKIVEQARNAEANILLDAELAGKGELETLAAVRDARQLSINQLQDAAVAARKLADELQSPEAIKFADDLQLALKKASAEIDPLAARLNGVLGDAFSNSFADFITGTQTAAQAFRSFARSVVNDLAKIASQALAKQIFGGNVGGIGGLLSGLFGSTSGPTPGGQVGSTGGVDFAGIGYPLATGTDFVPYDGFLAKLHKGERVTPAAYNPSAGGGNGGNTYVQVMPPAGHTAREERSQQGNDDLVKIIIEKAAQEVDNRIAKGGSTHRVIAATYGMSRAAGAPKRG